MGVIARAFKWAVYGYVASFLVITLWTLLVPIKPATAFERADVIIVFGAGMSPAGVLDEASRLRVTRGVEIYNAGAASRIHFTGGLGAPGGPSAGGQMAKLAIEQGVPEDAISIEGRSLSTLQNALFSKPYLSNFTTAILVSEGFHLPRVATSVYWVGGFSETQWAVSTRFRSTEDRPLYNSTRMMLREALAWWFNVGRMALYTVAGPLGVGDETRAGWLA